MASMPSPGYTGLISRTPSDTFLGSSSRETGMWLSSAYSGRGMAITWSQQICNLDLSSENEPHIVILV